MLAAFPHPKYLTRTVTDASRAYVTAVAEFAQLIGFPPIFGGYHWDVGAYGKADADLINTRRDAIAVFEGLLASGLVPKG